MKASRETILAFATVTAVVLLASATIFFSAWSPDGDQAVFFPPAQPANDGDLDPSLEPYGQGQDASGDVTQPVPNGRASAAGNSDPASSADNHASANRPSDQQSPEQQRATYSSDPSDELWTIVVGNSVLLRLAGNGVGSGVLVGKDVAGRLMVLTVWHAAKLGVEGVDFFSIRSGRRPLASSQSVEVVSKSERRDLAVLRVTVGPGDVQKLEPTLPLCDKLPQQPLKSVFSLGCEDGGPAMPLNEQIVGEFLVRLPRQSEPTLMWKTKVPQSAGRSGGGLVDSEGNLLGIALGKSETGTRAGYYCHHQEIVSYLIDNELGWLLKCGTSGK